MLAAGRSAHDERLVDDEYAYLETCCATQAAIELKPFEVSRKRITTNG